MAEKAGKAAPAMAISAGVLVAVPHGHAVAPVRHGTVAEAVTAAKTQAGGVASANEAMVIAKTTYASSASLSTAQRAATASYQARHARTVQSAASEAHAVHLAHLARLASEAHAAHLAHLAHLSGGDHVSGGVQSVNEAHAAHLAHLAHLNHSGGYASSSSSHQGSTETVSHVSHSAPVESHGIYGCSALESLWEEAGGSSGTAFIAAEIARAESGGNPNAISPTDDFGLWQINGSHGSMATLDPMGNARAAVSISDGGHDWNAWTTYTAGAYAGRC
ncbi:MAG TPA: transglycosylase SLT domain-containing protein [Streptosporangiaceae bacterium]